MSKSSMKNNRTSKKTVSNTKKISNKNNMTSKKIVKKKTNRSIPQNVNSNKKVVKKVEKSNVNNVKKVRSNDIEKRDIKNNVKNIDNSIKKFPNKNVSNIHSKESKPKTKKRQVFLVSTFIIVGICICIIYLVFNLTTFDVKKITVTGNSKYTSNEIVSKCPFKINENVFSQYLKYKNTELKGLPYISSLNVELVFPDEINLNVVEREEKYVAYDKEKNKFYKLDKDGYILEETTQTNRSENEMLVYGVTFNNEILFGEQINEIDLGKLRTYEKIAEEYEKSGMNGNITKVNFENSLTTITLNDKLNIVLPNDTNLEYNLDLLKSILKKNGDLQGIIDMTKKDPVFSIF